MVILNLVTSMMKMKYDIVVVLADITFFSSYEKNMSKLHANIGRIQHLNLNYMLKLSQLDFRQY